MSSFTGYVSRIYKESNTLPAKVLEAREFQRILAQERARADRNQHNFSLLSFSVPSVSARCHEARAVAKEMDRRLRFTDVIGCLDSEHITAFLPETHREGTQVVEKTLRRALKTRGVSLESRIDCYPPDGATHKPARSTATRRAPRVPLAGIPGWKRVMDVAGASVGILLLAPLLALVALFIRMVSPGPVLYSQVRIGFKGRKFKCYKFRTMHADSDCTVHQKHIEELIENGKPLRKLDAQDSRIIPFGRVLRATAIDELPQLVNVLRGDMSLVGPRPDMPYAVSHYQAWNTRRFDTTPGLTGLWQVSGKNRTTHNEMMRFDVRYVQHRSLWFDLQIILRTFPAIAAEIWEQLFVPKLQT